MEIAHFNMIEQQVRPCEIFDPRVLTVMSEIPREQFVPQNYQSFAFADIAIPLSKGREMVTPRIAAKILQALNIQPDQRVFEIGTGSGYLTACLATLGAEVTSTESIPTLSEAAALRMESLAIEGVTLLIQEQLDDITTGDLFDAIVATAPLTEVSETLKQRLTIGGRLYATVTAPPQSLGILITRSGESVWRSEILFENIVDPSGDAQTSELFHF